MATSSVRRVWVTLVTSWPLLQGCGGSIGQADAAAGASSLGGSVGTVPAGGGTANACTPGATQDCSGPGRCAGAQACLQDGSGWGICDCGSGGGASHGGTAGTGGASPAGGNPPTGGSPEGGSASGGAAATGGSPEGGTPSGGSPAAGGSPTGGATSGRSATGGAAGVGGAGGGCVESTAEVKLRPPVLEFVIDITGSMGEDAYPTDPNNNATKLAELKRILPPVFASLPPDWAVGIEFFNYRQGSGCYQGRQTVPTAPLETNLNAINTAVAALTAQNYTPTYAAWLFGLQQVQAFNDPVYAASARSIVLITDGAPTVTNDGCTIQMPVSQSTYDALISQVQANGMGGSPRVKTYVIGLLGSEDPQGATYDPLYELSLLAIAGGTGATGCTPVSGTVVNDTVNPRGTYCHFDLTSNPDFATGLQGALAAVSGQQTGCTYGLPAAPAASDPARMVVTYTPGGTAARQLVRTDGACVGGQWFVSAIDAGGNPTALDLCPDACAAVRGDPTGTLEVTFQCLLGA